MRSHRYQVINSFPLLMLITVQAKLDVAANTPGLIMVIACHGIQASNGTAAYSVRADMMRMFIDCRYGTQTHPRNANEGLSLGSVPAIPGQDSNCLSRSTGTIRACMVFM